MENHQNILLYLNWARQNPRHYLILVEQQLKAFQNQLELAISQQIIYQTNQGRKAWLEAYQFLNNQKPLPPFSKNQGLCLAARQHCYDICKNNIFGHVGSDNSTFSQRIQRFCRKTTGSMVEIIGADFLLQSRNTAEMTILGLIIDDGVPDRGHRNAIFNKDYTYTGYWSGEQGDKIVTVFTLSQSNLQLKTGSEPTNDKSQIAQNNYDQYKNKRQSKRQSRNHHQQIHNNTPKENSNGFSSTYKEHKNNNFVKSQTAKYVDRSRIFADLDKNTHCLTSQGFYKLPNMLSVSTGIKTISEKKQSVRTLADNGCKVSQIKTTIKYTDGTIQENVERLTTFTQ